MEAGSPRRMDFEPEALTSATVSIRRGSIFRLHSILAESMPTEDPEGNLRNRLRNQHIGEFFSDEDFHAIQEESSSTVFNVSFILMTPFLFVAFIIIEVLKSLHLLSLFSFFFSCLQYCAHRILDFLEFVLFVPSGHLMGEEASTSVGAHLVEFVVEMIMAMWHLVDDLISLVTRGLSKMYFHYVGGGSRAALTESGDVNPWMAPREADDELEEEPEVMQNVVFPDEREEREEEDEEEEEPLRELVERHLPVKRQSPRKFERLRPFIDPIQEEGSSSSSSDEQFVPREYRRAIYVDE